MGPKQPGLHVTSPNDGQLDPGISRQLALGKSRQLELGMSKREVTRLIGYPLINDPFHKDRWDYYYSMKTGKTGEVVKQRASLQFENEQLAKIDSSFLAEE